MTEETKLPARRSKPIVKPPKKSPSKNFNQAIEAKAGRKLHARRHVTKTIWFGLGMMGVIGWSVAIPTLLGAMLGLWLDRHYAGDRSWTLALLVAGLCLGCFNAWHWVDKEDKAMRKEREENDD